MTKTPPPQTEQIEDVYNFIEDMFIAGRLDEKAVTAKLKALLTASNRELLERLKKKSEVKFDFFLPADYVSVRHIEAELKRLGE